MSINKELLDMIVCPKCKGELREQDDTLLCAACQVTYKILDGIPVLIADEALPVGQKAKE